MCFPTTTPPSPPHAKELLPTHRTRVLILPMTSTSDHRGPPPPLHRLRHYPRSSASFKSCCCCLFLLLVFLVLLAVAVALVLVLAVKPKKPDFKLRQVGVSYILVTLPPSKSPTASSSSAYLTMNITLLFLAANPNKVGIRYESPGLDVMYKGVPLGSATVPSFEVPAHGSRLVETRVVVSRLDLLQSDAVHLVRDASVYDRVEFRVVGDVGASIRVLSFTSPKVKVSVDCAVVVSPSKQSVTSTRCGVDGLSV